MKTMRVRRSSLGHSGQQHRRMEEVLHTMQYDGLIGTVGECDDCLQPQQIDRGARVGVP
jgi:hypothetical protein